MPRNPISCRLACYRPHEALAGAHLQSLGVRHVEVRLPGAEQLRDAPDWAAREAERLASHGLTATTVHGDLDLERVDTGAQVLALAQPMRRFGCTRLFVALRPLAIQHETQWARLRAAGEAACSAGVTIVLETHPDLAGNADQALRTLEAVDQRALRLNFDTANIYFYNAGLDCVNELRRVAPWVAAVHLKESGGGLGERRFPALGRGRVDFRGVFDVLDAVGFDGPYTLEIEGIAGQERTAELILEQMTESVAFLRGLGRV